MKYINKLATLFCGAAFGLLAMTSCEGGDLYGVNSPDWLQEKIDSINAAKGQGGEEDIPGMMEDVYTIGATDYSTGWWAQFSKYYKIHDNMKWYGQFNLNINPSASNTYKNFALILTNDVDRGGAGYKEYGAIRFDNQPSGNSEWGDYINRANVESNLTFGTDTDPGIDKLGGLVTLSIDRTDSNNFIVKITNGTVTKTYTHGHAIENLNEDPENTAIRAFLVPEGSYIGWLKTNIEPIGGCTSAEDKQPLSMTLNNLPKKVLVGTDFEEITKNITANVQFETGVAKDAANAELSFVKVGDFNTLGKKSIVAIFNKTYKGENCVKPVTATFEVLVVDKMYNSIGATDNSTAFWGAHSDYIKVAPGETYVSEFTNYSNQANNWNNFYVVLTKADGTENAVLRADNYGWGDGYGTCTATTDVDNWDEWRPAMDGARVTTYVTNNGDGTADVKAVMDCTNMRTYVQEYKGISTVDPENFYFHYTVEGSHIEFDSVLGNEDNTSGWWSEHSAYINVPAGKSNSTTFVNYTSGANNWNNFCVVLTKIDGTEYAVVRADNYGWGDGYGTCTPIGTQGEWGPWLADMDEARVTVTVTNVGDGTANIKAIMIGNSGKIYTQEYNGISGIDGDNCYYHMTIDNCHLVFDSSSSASSVVNKSKRSVRRRR